MQESLCKYKIYFTILYIIWYYLSKRLLNFIFHFNYKNSFHLNIFSSLVVVIKIYIHFDIII